MKMEKITLIEWQKKYGSEEACAEALKKVTPPEEALIWLPLVHILIGNLKNFINGTFHGVSDVDVNLSLVNLPDRFEDVGSLLSDPCLGWRLGEISSMVVLGRGDASDDPYSFRQSSVFFHGNSLF